MDKTQCTLWHKWCYILGLAKGVTIYLTIIYTLPVEHRYVIFTLIVGLVQSTHQGS